MASTRKQKPLMGSVLILIVIGTSIVLRKSVPDQATRVAIGMVEIPIIAILAFRFFRPPARN
jgi:hypothetical protein